MQIGESVAVLIVSPEKEQCPFCDSKAEDKEIKKVMVNDSIKLATNLGGMPKVEIENPVPVSEDYYIHEQYWENIGTSRVCFNAHHIIPGNAALAEAPELLKWFAWEVTMEKKYYDSKIEAVVKNVAKSKQDGKREELYEAKFKKSSFYTNTDKNVLFCTTKGKSGAVRKLVTNEHLVKGEVDFDVNDFDNGIWLPSNNAVYKWADVKGIQAKNYENKVMSFDKAYAHNAMHVTRKHFHDAHEKYSKAVKRQLLKLAKEVEVLAQKCVTGNHESSASSDKGPFPAPARLNSAIVLLASRISGKLDLDVTKKPKGNWYTSSLVKSIY